MALMLELPDLRGGYLDLIDQVTRHGKQTSPRGLPIIELRNVMFTVNDLEDTLPIGIGRDLNTTVAALEALQLIGGVSTPELLVAAAPQFTNYREDSGHFHGAYGTRVGDQVQHAIDKLHRDIDSRRAVVTLWDPDLDNWAGLRDYPCTLALVFAVRDDALDLTTIMRSNDVWLGVAYDVFQFTQLQWTVAHALQVEPGTYTHVAISLHIYERDLVRCAKLHRPQDDTSARLPHGIERGSWSQARAAAQALLQNDHVDLDHDTAGTSWYRRRLNQLYEKLGSR